MDKFVSIKTKLVVNTQVLLSVAFLILLSVILASNMISVNKSIEKSQKNIRNSLIAKGKTLAKNNSLAMSGMAEDNSFTAIQALVASTTADDEDLVYGIYMDKLRIPWVYANSENPSGIPRESKPLSDTVSLWASTLHNLAFREITSSAGKITIIEFAAPVMVEDDILGFIRYGFSTRAMEFSMKESRESGKASRFQSIVIILTMGLISFVIGFFIIRKIAVRITSPIASLVNSSKIIAEGNYNAVVKQESNDEIGDLAGHFEAMRATIKKYTEHLQDIIDEKMQQVNDILNNIDQGLFTINLDGTVNQEYSASANKILHVGDIASYTIQELLRMDAKKEAAFRIWLELVRKQHACQRWIKLARLAPVQELELRSTPDSTDLDYISISYQRVYDKEGNLAKIMVLAVDETEKRLKDKQMAMERIKHENDVKAILSIANTPAEEIMEFTEDTRTRIRNLHDEVTFHIDGVNFQRENHPVTVPYVITKEQIDLCYRDLHTIKGNSGSYGFESLSHLAHQAEDELEKLREPVNDRRGSILAALDTLLGKMDNALDDIIQKINLIFGQEEEITVRIPETRIKTIVNMSKQIGANEANRQVRELLSECVMLSWKPLKTILRKYHKLVLKTARQLHKNLNCTIGNDNKLYPPNIVIDLDDVLIHLIRNAVDHGVEDPDIRDELGKGLGHIRITLEYTDTTRTISIADDGRGIDTDQLAEKCVRKGILTKDEVLQLSESDKMMLLFKGGISTTESVSDISGRGMGMQIVYHKITNILKGSIEINSIVGKGTTITVHLPFNPEF